MKNGFGPVLLKGGVQLLTIGNVGNDQRYAGRDSLAMSLAQVVIHRDVVPVGQ